MEVMQLSSNPNVKKLAKKLQTRVRMSKLRTAARFAGENGAHPTRTRASRKEIGKKTEMEMILAGG